MSSEVITGMMTERKPKWLLFLAELRAPFLVSTNLPVLQGTAMAFAQTGKWDWVLYILAAVCVALINAAANVANDYCDHLSGNDPANVDFVRPFTGGSRMIQNGFLSPSEVLGLAVVVSLLCVAIGVYLVWRAGVVVLVLGIIGLAGGLLYTTPPVKLAARGLGELAVGLNAGMLPVIGSYYIQTGTLTWDVVLLSLPLALLIAAILFINQFQDYRADMVVGKNNWVVRLGRRRSVFVYMLLMVMWPLPVITAVLLHCCSKWCFLSLTGLIPAFVAIGIAFKYYDEPQKLTPANALTIITHFIVGVIISTVMIVIGWHS
jgi:1,4-dihydroxy-2-naphthoate octaprenyltransferase